MCLIVNEVPTSAHAGLVWPCGKSLRPAWHFHSSVYGYQTTPRNAAVPKNGWLFPATRSEYQNWFFGRVINGGVIHGSMERSPSRYCYSAWAIGVVAFGQGNLVARALFIPHVAEETCGKILVRRTEAALRRLSDGYGGRPELYKLNPRLRYALTGKK